MTGEKVWMMVKSIKLGKVYLKIILNN